MEEPQGLYKIWYNILLWHCHCKGDLTRGGELLGAVAVFKIGDKMNKINKNTWYKLSPLFKALITSTNSKSGDYKLKKTDKKHGFYFEYFELNLKIAIPLSAIFQTNDKITGILGIQFISSTDCPSRTLGTCQLPDTALCYGRSGENQSRPKHNGHGLKGMGGELKGTLSSYYWDRFAESSEYRHRFLLYCDYYKIDTLRFNLKGDFRSSQDISIIYYLANTGRFACLTGYTARDDLFEDLITLISDCGAVKLNGSNIKYTNRFFVTAFIEDMVTASHWCLGGCKGCSNCYKLEGQVIYCLLHGSGADTVLNNLKNQEFLANWSRSLYVDILEGVDWSESKGLRTCVNKALERNGHGLRFGSNKELIQYIRRTYRFKGLL